MTDTHQIRPVELVADEADPRVLHLPDPPVHTRGPSLRTRLLARDLLGLAAATALIVFGAPEARTVPLPTRLAPLATTAFAMWLAILGQGLYRARNCSIRSVEVLRVGRAALIGAAAGDCSLATALDLSAGYHTVGLHWTATKYEIYVDGTKRWSSPSGANVASAYHHLIINLALGNNDHEFDWNQEPVRPLDPSVLTSGAFPKPTVEWDYVRVWQAPGHHDTCTTGNC